MKVYVKNSQKDLLIKTKQVKLLVHSFLVHHKIDYSEIAIHLVEDKKMRLIHQQFFNDPSPTDCMTFPVDPFDAEEAILGDIFVCPQVAVIYAKDKQIDPYKELSLYIVHGLLHLLGYDDIESKDRKVMRSLEKKELARLEKKGLWLTS